MQNTNPTIEPSHHDLEMDEDLSLQEKGWIVQKIVLSIIFLVILCGLLGLFGDGVLSKRLITSGYVTVEFDHFYRYETEMRVLVESREHMNSISLNAEYLKKFRIIRMVPESESIQTSGHDIIFNFLPSNNRTISIYIVPKGFGEINGTLKVNKNNNINLSHFIFP